MFHHIATLQNPVAAQCGQSLLHCAVEIQVTPRAGAIIDRAPARFARWRRCRIWWREFDFAHRHADIGMQPARDVNTFALRQLFAAVRFERLFVCDHGKVFSFKFSVFYEHRKILLKKGGLGSPPLGGRAQAPSFASITWIRFRGSSAFRAELSAFVVPADGRLAPRINGKLGLFAHSVKPAKIILALFQNFQCRRKHQQHVRNQFTAEFKRRVDQNQQHALRRFERLEQ